VTNGFDLAFPVKRTSDPEAWTSLGRLYLPSRPRHLRDGATVWLRHGSSFFYSYQVEAVRHDDSRDSDVDGSQFGPGPSLYLVPGSGRRRDLPLNEVADPDVVGASWTRGFRYLQPGATAFVRVGAGADRGAPSDAPRLIPPDEHQLEPIEVVTAAVARQAEQVEAHLVRRYRDWLGDHVTVEQYVIPTPGGTLRTDLYLPDAHLLIEAKAAASRHHLRLAIGQLYDYLRFLSDPAPFSAVLVPERPTGDLMGLLDFADVEAIWSEGDGFVDSADGRYTTRLRG
jgi:hypothetical protein